MSFVDIKNKSQGFTIVELLIVVVVIAILAAITIVSYNGITNRANASAAKATASTFQKKAELYQSETGRYPISMTELSDTTKSYSLTGTGFAYGIVAPTKDNGTNTVRILKCATSAANQAAIDGTNITGLEVTYWNFEANALGTPITLGTGTCPAVAGP